MEPRPGGAPAIAGRTPIACQNCANAKTGCDKGVPCSRCAEKKLPCAARFARRSSKAAVRAAAATSGLSRQTATGSPAQHISPSAMEIDQIGSKPHSPVTTPPTTSAEAMIGAIDPRLQGTPQRQETPQSHPGPDEFPSPHTKLKTLDEFVALPNDFVTAETSYQDLLCWPDYSIDLDMYSGPMQLGRSDMVMPQFSDLSEISSTTDPVAGSSTRGSIHTRGTSILSTGDFENPTKPIDLTMVAPTGSSIPEFEVVLASEAAWPLARCNPPIFSGACPRTAIVHLECLELKSKQEGTWASLECYAGSASDSTDIPQVVGFSSRSRDRMLAITQGFLHKALEIHRGSQYQKHNYSTPGEFNFIVLPPNKLLEYFLRSYVRSLSDYYSLVVGGIVDPNDMLHSNQASTLLVLLMIAQGAAAVPCAEARYLSARLTETCRISLFDIIEKNIELSADPTALRCALLFTLLGAWGGDKWQMDIAMGQRGMYLAVRLPSLVS